MSAKTAHPRSYHRIAHVHPHPHHDFAPWPAAHRRAVQETQALLSMPGMRDAIQAGLAEPLAACAKALDW